MRALDVGCGTGRFTAALETRFPTVVGIDIDPAMIVIAARRVRGPLLIADAHALPFADESFDATTAITLCEFASDPSRVVSELGRVTRPGGRIVVGALNRRSLWGCAGRRRFRHIPWNSARFLSRRGSMAIGSPLGRSSLSGALFVPGIARAGHAARIIEAIGKRALPSFGAFQVLVIEKDSATLESDGRVSR